MTKETYSQYNQDKWVLSILNKRKDGFFLDLASGDGIDISNTFLLEKNFNWKGICIEANDNLFKKLKINRNCICDNSCIDNKIHNIKFSTNKTIELSSGIIERGMDNENQSDYVIKKTNTIKNILNKYDCPRVIDYFSLDVEGAEENIITSFPFKDYKFLTMSVERPSNKSKEILKQNGYIRVGRNDCDTYFLNKDFFNSKSLLYKVKIILISNIPFVYRKFKHLIINLSHGRIKGY